MSVHQARNQMQKKKGRTAGMYIPRSVSLGAPRLTEQTLRLGRVGNGIEERETKHKLAEK